MARSIMKKEKYKGRTIPGYQYAFAWLDELDDLDDDVGHFVISLEKGTTSIDAEKDARWLMVQSYIKGYQDGQKKV